MKVYAIGGYSEAGKNMTAIEVDNKVVIFDMGLYLPAIINYADGDAHTLNGEQLQEIGAIPQDELIKNKEVIAIVAGHGHLDHVGAIPYLAGKYNCPVIGTRYTVEIIRDICKDKKIDIKNLRVLNNNSRLQFGDFTIQFIHITHSIPQTCLVVLHTKEGNVVYCNDFKLDNNPVIGKKPNYEAIKKVENVKLLIMDSLNSEREGKTPSERVARELLKDVMLNENLEGSCIIVTTFASHIQRLKSIVEMSKRINRKIVFLGRSLHKYVGAAENIELVNFSKDAEIIGFSGKVKSKLSEINKNKGDYVVICTGNQGEPGAVLRRIAENETPFKFSSRDMVIFSCRTIPTPETEENREYLEGLLKKSNVRVFKDIHVSGHGSQGDHREMIEMLKPEYVLPSHGDAKITKPVKELAERLGYKSMLMKDQQVIKI
jgi:ribonuclease J